MPASTFLSFPPRLPQSPVARRAPLRRVVRKSSQYFPQSTRVLSAKYFFALRHAFIRLPWQHAAHGGRPTSVLPGFRFPIAAGCHGFRFSFRHAAMPDGNTDLPPQVLQTASRTEKNRKKMNKYAENASRRPAPRLSPVSRKRTSSGKKKAGPTKKHQNGKPSKQFFPPRPACLLRKKARTAFGIHVFCLPLPYGTAGTSIRGERPLGRNRVHRLRHRPTRTPDTNAPST